MKLKKWRLYVIAGNIALKCERRFSQQLAIDVAVLFFQNNEKTSAPKETILSIKISSERKPGLR